MNVSCETNVWNDQFEQSGGLLMAWVWISCHAFVFLLLIFRLFGLGHNVFMFPF